MNHGIVLFSLFVSLTSYAGGTFIGNGGHVVACFNEEFKESFFKGGDLSAEGQQKIQSLDVLDYYAAKRQYPAAKLINNEIPGICDTHESELYEVLWERLEGVNTNFHDSISCTRFSTPFDFGVGVDGELAFASDAALGFELPGNCSLRQAVIRQGSSFYFNRKLLLRMDRMSCVPQRAILRMHEDFYTAAVNGYDHQDSARSRQLLEALLRNSKDATKIAISSFGKIKANACLRDLQ